MRNTFLPLQVLIAPLLTMLMVQSLLALENCRESRSKETRGLHSDLAFEAQDWRGNCSLPFCNL